MEFEKRNCQECDKELIKRKYESRARYGKKKFCSSECSRKYLKRNKLGWWKHDILASRPRNPEETNVLEALDEFGFN